LFFKNCTQPRDPRRRDHLSIFWLYQLWSQSGRTSGRAERPERSHGGHSNTGSSRPDRGEKWFDTVDVHHAVASLYQRMVHVDDLNEPGAKQIQPARPPVVPVPYVIPRQSRMRRENHESNLQGIRFRAVASSLAADWSVKRRLEYIEWAQNVVAGLRGISPWLEQQFYEAAAAAERSLNPPMAGA
jgi:hypothetical protein